MVNAVVCRDLHKTYEDGKQSVHAVDGLSLEVRVGECFGLLGPNGAGKTTTVEIWEGLLPPSSGFVEVLGEHWGRGRDSELRQRLGITLQETRLQDKLTVREVLRLFRSFYREGITEHEALALVELQEKSESWVRKLSGGQRQRLAVATALVGRPELLFLDEPTTGLDPQARRQLWDVVNDLKRQGKTIVLTTHYMDEAEKLCDRVAIIDHGRTIALGTPRDLISKLGGENVMEFAVEGLTDPAAHIAQFEALPSVRSVILESDGFRMTVSELHRTLPALIQGMDARGLHLSRLTTRHTNLEDVFVSLTGRHLRDE